MHRHFQANARGYRMHYVPEVKDVQQVLEPEEEVALDEFAKLEVCC